MPNSNYIAGRRYEYKLVHEHKARGFDVCQRTAGSRSPVDIFCVDFHNKIIKWIQAKPKSMSPACMARIEEKEKRWNGKFDCIFRVM